MRVRGFAELLYRDSARLSFARACERIDHDVSLDHPEAWVVDDRRISFSMDCDMSLLDLQRYQRLFEELARDAIGGELALEGEGQPRWVVPIGQASSGIPGARSSETTSIDTADTDVTAVRYGGRSS
ncbi:MAG: hypothetical protein HOW73_00040 [Polyangiaceae bacterium]|nr:hypothetical protein [Polyangiaceae bacterium]